MCLRWHFKIIVSMPSTNIAFVKRAMVSCPNSPSCLSLFSCMFVPILLEIKVLVFAFHKSQLTIESTFFNKWCKEMSSLSIYMLKYCFGFLLLERNPLKVALPNLSQFSRLSPIARRLRMLQRGDVLSVLSINEYLHKIVRISVCEMLVASRHALLSAIMRCDFFLGLGVGSIWWDHLTKKLAPHPLTSE